MMSKINALSISLKNCRILLVADFVNKVNIIVLFIFKDADKARKHGMEDYIQADPCQFDHHQIFSMLQSHTLKYRLQDPYCSLVIIILNQS